MSSRKSLLSEGTVRRFMKLATLDNLTETFVDTLDEEDELESELHATEDELGAEDHVADEEADELAVVDDDAALDVDPETVEALVSAIADAIGDVTGTEVTVSSDEGPEDLAPEDLAPEDFAPEEEVEGEVEVVDLDEDSEAREDKNEEENVGDDEKHLHDLEKDIDYDKGHIREEERQEEGPDSSQACRRTDTTRRCPSCP